MNPSAWLAGALAALTIAILSVLMWRARREVARLRARLGGATADLQNLQLAFSRFAPDEVIERVIAEGLEEFGEKKDVTALFADLRGFTALSESADATLLVRVVNGYFERMSRAISEHRGHVSKFIGDGILAFFGALTPNPWQANDAVYAALAMRAALAEYNGELDAQGLPRLAAGIGIDRGTGIAGLVGSQDLKEFTVVGRAVNVAARVQDLTRRYDVDIIVTAGVASQLDPRVELRPLPPSAVKGVAEPVAIYAVVGAGERGSVRTPEVSAP